MLEEIVRDLIDLQTPLRRDSLTERTADAIAAVAGSFHAAWRSGKKIKATVPIPIPRNQGLHPQHAEAIEAFLSFAFFSPVRHDVVVEDVFVEIQVRVCGLLSVGAAMVELEDHWRIDTQAKQEGEPRESHPIFHFQRGGHAQDAFAGSGGFVPGPSLPTATSNWRGLMQYPGPRIPVVPMCPTVAIDFILSQHDGPLWRRLMNNPEYFNLVGRCQDRLWKLYAAALADDMRRRMLFGHLRRG